MRKITRALTILAAVSMLAVPTPAHATATPPTHTEAHYKTWGLNGGTNYPITIKATFESHATTSAHGVRLTGIWLRAMGPGGVQADRVYDGWIFVHRAGTNREYHSKMFGSHDLSGSRNRTHVTFKHLVIRGGNRMELWLQVDVGIGSLYPDRRLKFHLNVCRNGGC